VQLQEVSDGHSLLYTEGVGFNVDHLFFKPVHKLVGQGTVKFDVTDGSIAHDVASNDDM